MNSTATALASAEVLYSSSQAGGIIVIIVAAVISLAALLGLLVGLLVVHTRPEFNNTAEYLFLQSNFGIYFISLLYANAIAAIGSIMNARWVGNKAIQEGAYCSAQGAVKNIGNVATALWTLVIAVHVFNLLFLRHQTKRLAAIFVTIATWSAVLTIDIFGPAVLQKQELGAFFGIAGYWCWITDQYPLSRVGVEYFWFFFGGAMSFILYVLVFLRLRGNIVFPEGSRLPRFIWVPRAKAWKLQMNRDAIDAHMVDSAKQMIWFPVAYTIIIIPIALGRFIHDSPLGYVVFADSIFMLTGVINVVVFMSIRRVLPKPGVLPTFNIPRKAPPSIAIPDNEMKVEPFVLSASSEKSFGTHDRNSRLHDSPIVQEAPVIVNLGGTFRGKDLSQLASRNNVGAAPQAQPMPSPGPHVHEADIARAPSPPVERNPYQLHSRQGSQESLGDMKNPFGDEHQGPEYDSEDEYDGFGERRQTAYSISGYFDEVDLVTPKAGAGFGHGHEDVPPVPSMPNRI
ncbi:hypothetical protein DL93DRAFT_2114128 [Clavulina sp. PMI_390]|nr:hypothetical protein DL93DRAFT_2114128 [Clavulina sp. PMI_390]